MGRTSAAFPWEGPLFALHTKNGLGQKLKNTNVFNSLTFEHCVYALALLHLGGLGSFLVTSEMLPFSLFISCTGSLLVLVLIWRYGRTWHPTPSEARTTPLVFKLKSTAEELKDRSITFLELLHSTRPTRTAGVLPDPLWAELTARMSHDLRTPLNAVLGFSDLIQAETFGPLGDDRYRDYIQYIQDSCRDLLKSTENTLALTSFLGKPSPRLSSDRVSLGNMLQNTEDFFRKDIQTKGVKLSYETRCPLEIQGERTHIQHILRNVFAEALSRVQDGGTLGIRTGPSGARVSLTLEIQNPKSVLDYEQASLELCIARVLLEHQGSPLVVQRDAKTWVLTLYFDRAVQEDFFARVTNSKALSFHERAVYFTQGPADRL